MSSVPFRAQPLRSAFRAFTVVSPFLPVFLLIGCGRTERYQVPAVLASVKGKVTLDGKAVTSGQVSLLPELIDPNNAPPSSSGKIESDGSYEIFTGGKSGAPVGKFKVGVTPDMSKPLEKGAEALPKKYMDPAKSKLWIDVQETVGPGRYDLKLTK